MYAGYVVLVPPDVPQNRTTVASNEGHPAHRGLHSSVDGWPNLFGPSHNNVSRETGLVMDWPAEGPSEKWRISVGRGYSSPVVHGNRLVLLHRRDDEEIVECFDAETGDPCWQFRYPTTYQCIYEYSDGPYSTPVLDEHCVYCVGAEGQFHCLRLETGELVWRRLLHEEFTVERPLFAVGASPLLEGDRLIFNLGARDDKAGIIALDKRTGETLWTATDHGASYATACAAIVHQRKMAFVVTFEGLVALDPATGRIYWSIPFRPRAPDTVNATSPLVAGDLVLMVSGPGPGSLCLRILPDGNYQEVWSDRRVLDSQFNSLIPSAGFVYGYSSKRQDGATFRCVDLHTGELRWKWASPLARGSAVAAHGRFILWGEHGHLASLDVTPDKPVVRSLTENPLLSSPCYSAPALHRGLLYLRNETTLLCLSLRGERH
jgi:outer membrane protein assembly factor BamB